MCEARARERERDSQREREREIAKREMKSNQSISVELLGGRGRRFGMANQPPEGLE